MYMTRRNIKYKTHHRTKKHHYLGGEPFHKHEGIFQVIGQKLSGYAGEVGEYVKDKTLRLAGLEPIEPEPTPVPVSSSPAPSVLSTMSANALHQLNEFLLDPTVQRSLQETLQKTSIVLKNILQKVNDALSDPQLKEETKIALEHVADYVGIFVQSMDGPLNDALDTMSRSGTKALSAALAGLIKVLTDMAAAVPGVGAVIELGKMANDASAAAGDVVESATNTTTAISQAISDTSENFQQGLEALHQKKQESANRTRQSMRQFMGGMGGGKKGGPF